MKSLSKHTLCLGLFGLSALLPAVSLSAQEDALVRHPRIGYCTHIGRSEWPLEQSIEAAKNSGTTWIRDDFNWTAIEQEKGVYSLPDADRFRAIDAANEAGLKVLAIFNVPRGGHPLYKDTDAYDPDAYARAAAWFAKEMKGKVDAIEILNEPFGFGFRQHYGGTWNGVEPDGSNSVWVHKYVELLNKTAKAVKEANPDMKVIGLGCVAPTNFRMLEMGIAPEVDGIADHPYSYRTVPEILPFAATASILERDGGTATADAQGTFASQIRMYREQSEKHNGPKELWLTEFGWTTYIEKEPSKYYTGFTESAQAKYITRRIAEALGLGVEKVMIYDLKDDYKSPYSAEHRFGVMDFDFNPKPAYGAVQRLARGLIGYEPKQSFEINAFPLGLRPDPEPIQWDGSELKAQGNVRAYQFANEQGEPLVALWVAERANGDRNPAVVDVEIVSGRPISKINAYDVFADTTSEIPFVTKKGRIVMEKMLIPDSPLLLTFEQ